MGIRTAGRRSKGPLEGRRPESDLDLWRQVTRGVTPLSDRTGARDTGASPPGSDRAVCDRPRHPSPPPARDGVPSGRTRHEFSAALRHGDGAGIDRRTHDRFRRGRMAIEGRLDLHGMTRERAHQALTVFLHRAHDRGARCILVVTGKGMGRDGGGVLRRDVPHWLNQAGLRHVVLGIAHAQPRDGGEGALYVLLKRRREGGA